MRLTKYKFSILMLVMAFVVALTAFFTLNTYSAHAAGDVTVSGTNVFTSSGDANVIAHKEGDGDDAKYYSMFTFASEDDVISYRRNLAYRWFERVFVGSEEEEKYEVNEGLFSMEIGFEDLSFEKFVITFESQEYNKTKDGKALNYIIFYPYQENSVSVVVTDDKDAGVDESQGNVYSDKIRIEFTEKLSGEYRVAISDGVNTLEKKNDGEYITFKNVAGNYAKSSTSSTSPVYPLIFNAEFGDEEDNEDVAKMVLYGINGQDFEIIKPNYSEEGDYYYGGTVKDSKPPVLCLENDFKYFTLGDKIDIDYVVIDVLRSSPSSTVHYYVLTYDQTKDGEVEDYEDEELFKEIKDDDIFLESDVDKYFPEENAIYNSNLKADLLVKVYITVTDITSNSETDDVYLDWYIDPDYLVTLNGSQFIAVAKDTLGATYNYDGAYGKTWEELIDEYQEQVTEAAKGLSAGSSSYFYLPSPEKLFTDKASSYTDLKLSIYYYHDSKQSNTSLATSNLSINLTKQGAYTFTIYATDAAGNNMYYLEEVENGEQDYDLEEGGKYYKIVEFESGDVWDMFDDKDNLYNKLPWFTFNVSYTGVSFEEEPGLQSTAYVGTSYSSASFSINGISDSYTTNYRLFIFDRAGYYNDKGITYSYETFIDVMDELFNGADTRKYFKEIKAVTESDADYEEFKDYGWTGTSTTFTPQVANAFYYIRAEVTDKQYNSSPVTCSLAVVSSENAKQLKGESQWLKNNIASVILLCIAGLALIGIILLLVIKPKDNGDIDEQFEKSKKSKKTK